MVLIFGLCRNVVVVAATEKMFCGFEDMMVFIFVCANGSTNVRAKVK